MSSLSTVWFESVSGDARSRHRLRVLIFALLAVLVLCAVAAYGWDYYGLDLSERAYSPKHEILRPSGTLGLRLGMAGVFLFCCLYLYPLRKRWAWLGRLGRTKHWLDFHVLFGITAPLTITLHSSLKFQGLAGVAYWLMIAVMVSGFVGRYLYAKVPRSISSAELSLADLETITAGLTREMESQSVLSSEDVASIFRLPSVQEVRRMSLALVILTMAWLDIRRVFQVCAVRRKDLRGMARLWTLNGLMTSENKRLENALRLVRQRSRMETKIAFLSRTNEVFHLWHVVHRPFSYSFALLAVFHVLAMVLLGYY